MFNFKKAFRKVLGKVQLLLCNQIPFRYLSLYFPHPIGIVIGSESTIAPSVVIYHNVTVGRRSHHDKGGYPTIEDNCIIYPGAMICGNITIRSHTIVNANAVVTKSTPGKCTVFGYNQIKRKNSQNN